MSEAVETTSAPVESAAPAEPILTPPDAAGRQTLDTRNLDATKAERRARAIAAAQAQRAPAKAAPESPKAAVEPAPAPTEEPPAPPVVEPAKVETAPAQSAAALELAKAQQALLKQQREAYEAKQRLKALEDKYKAAEEAKAKYESMSELDLLAARGKSYEQLTKEIVEGKHTPKTPEQIALEKYEAQLRAQEERLASFEREREAQRVEQLRAQETAYVAEQLKAAAEKFPLLNAVKWGPSKVVEAFYQHVQTHGSQPELEDVFSSLESALSTDAEPIFGSDAYLQRLLSVPEQRDRVLRLLGIKQTQPAQQDTTRAQSATANSPAAIPPTKAADPGTRKTPSKSISPAQRRAAAVAALMSRRS